MSIDKPFSEVLHFNTGSSPIASRPGTVSLVGAGPGDADLLTVKALRTIQQADLILFDRLVSEDIRALFPASTPAIYVGKVKDRHSIPQDQLNELLVTKARQGLNVCRLKGGDSLIFGRGSEEMLRLKEAEINVELVPGITAASGCTTYAGIPLTHRGLSQGCTFVTAHAEKDLNISWSALAGLNHTLVFYMGLSKAGMICEQLIANGLSPKTPMAFIENGCCEQQRNIIGTVEQMEALVEAENIQSPALIVVGETVKLSEQLQWFSSMSEAELQQLSA
jgi:uroporphyrin-III C-methyltransferase